MEDVADLLIYSLCNVRKIKLPRQVVKLNSFVKMKSFTWEGLCRLISHISIHIMMLDTSSICFWHDMLSKRIFCREQADRSFWNHAAIRCWPMYRLVGQWFKIPGTILVLVHKIIAPSWVEATVLCTWITPHYGSENSSYPRRIHWADTVIKIKVMLA